MLASIGAVVGALFVPVLSAAAEAGAETRAATGKAVRANPPQNRCEVNWVEEPRYPLKGYRIGSSCEELADFTKARGVENFPVKEAVTTDWFTDIGVVHASQWKPKKKIHPKQVAMQYENDGQGLNLYVPTAQITSAEGLVVTATTAKNQIGRVDLYAQRIGGAGEMVAAARQFDGRAQLVSPPGRLAAGDYQLRAIFTRPDGTVPYSTPSIFLRVVAP